MWNTVRYTQDAADTVTVTFYDDSDCVICAAIFSTFEDADTAVDIATKLASVHVNGVSVDEEKIEL